MEAPPDLGLASIEGDAQFGLLLELTRHIDQGASLQQVFGLVANALRAIFGIDRFAIVLRQSDGALHLADSRGLSAQYLDAVQAHIQEGAGARALVRRKPMWIPDAPASAEFAPLQEAARAEGFHTVLILPFFMGDDALGYLIMYHDEMRPYTAPEVTLAQTVAQQAAFAVERSHRFTATEADRIDLERRVHRHSVEDDAIDAIMLQISSSLDLGTTLQSIADAAAQLSNARYSSIWLRDEERNFRAVAAHGVSMDLLQQVVLPENHGLLGVMQRTAAPAVMDDMSQASVTLNRIQQQMRRTTGTTLAVPLLMAGEVMGALYVGRTVIEPFSPESLRLLERLAAFAHVAIRNARRFSDVEEKRSRLQAYIDAIPEGVIVFDIAGNVAMANQTIAREWHARVPAFARPGQSLAALTDPAVSGPLRVRFDPTALFHRVLERGEPERGLIEVEGSPQTYEMHFGPLHAQDRVDGVVATIRDVTVPLELGRERSRSHLLAELLDVASQLNSNLSVPALMEAVVEASLHLVGAQSGTLGLIENDRLTFRRFRLPSGWTDFDTALSRGEGAPGHVWVTMAPYMSNDCEQDPHVLSEIQHHLHFHKLVAVPMLDRTGKIVGVLNVYDPVVARDFARTDVEALQMLAHQAAIAIENARLNDLKDEFLSIVSHELKTPVTSIKGFAQILKRRLDTGSTDRVEHYLDVINHQADRLTSLINDLLDLSRIQTGRFSFELTEVDYRELLDEVVEEMRLVLGPNRLTLTAPEPVLVRGNKERLRQVLINLIDNGLQHGPTGGTVSVVAEAKDETVITHVQDEGAGVAPDEEERIFRPYYQVRHHPRQQARGVGLGLFISQQIIEEHGSKIWLERGEHTSFAFALQRM